MLSLLAVVLAALSADSMGAVLSLNEQRARGLQAAEAAHRLGQFHFARGEYEDAQLAFQRAVARSSGEARLRSRAEVGRALLALRQPAAARAAWSEALSPGGDPEGWARLGSALAWAMEGRHDRALQVVGPLVTGAPCAATAAALERRAAWLEHGGRGDDARRDQERLMREFPRSPEALRSARRRSEDGR
jgi:tetratricopeptide (TPR) repeat protein